MAVTAVTIIAVITGTAVVRAIVAGTAVEADMAIPGRTVAAAIGPAWETAIEAATRAGIAVDFQPMVAVVLAAGDTSVAAATVAIARIG